MFYPTFLSSFYWSFQVNNLEQIKKYVDSQTDIDNSSFNWGDECLIDRIELDNEEILDLIQPSIEKFAEDWNRQPEIKIYKPWINLYKRGYYQEVHDHRTDFGATIVLNDDVNFSKFYFFNRYSNFASNKVLHLFKNLSTHDLYYPNVKAGTIIFFPGTALHGVTVHKSDVVRKTLSFNIDIVS
jgi:hypothetical protein